MATRPETVDFILEQAHAAGDLSARKMFGEYALYCVGKVVALICDDTLYLKPTIAGKAAMGAATMGTPYPGAKPCFVIGGDRIEDAEWLSHIVRVTAAELPLPKAKTAKKKPPTKKSTRRA